MGYVALALMSMSGSGEEAWIDEVGDEHDLAVVRRPDLRSSHDEITCSLDVDDEVVALDLADSSDLFATLLEKHLIADVDLEIVGHNGFPPFGV